MVSASSNKACFMKIDLFNNELSCLIGSISTRFSIGRTYIVYMNSVGMFNCYLEDFETKKRAASGIFDNPGDAVEDAWNKIIKE